MSKPITESDIELLAIEQLESLGYKYLYGPDIAPEFPSTGGAPASGGRGGQDTRESYAQVLLLNRLIQAVQRINPDIPADTRTEAIKEIQRIGSPDLLANNETFHRLLTEGIPVTKRINGDDRGDRVWLIDFKNPENNEFMVINQFTIIENNHNKRPDVILFVNGIPLVVIELKNPADETATVRSAFNQIQTYKAVIPSLFTYNGFVIISDGLEAKAGTISSGFSRFMAWRTADGKTEASHLVGQMETLMNGMLNKETLLDLIRHFIVFEKHKKEDEKGITTINTVKKIAAYHQYYAVNKAVESTLRAAGYHSPPTEGCPPEADGVVPTSLGVQQAKPDKAVKRHSKNYFSLPYNPALKERARALRKAGNLSEVLFWNQVKNKQFKGYDFDRQKIIGNYIVDFYCGNCQVVVEIDGKSHDDKQEYDAQRDAYLESLGLMVIHIPALDILKRLGIVMEMLHDNPVFQGNIPLRPPEAGTPPREGNFSEDPGSYGLPGVKPQPVGDRKGGVVWHTQGSGKSLSMVFLQVRLCW